MAKKKQQSCIWLPKAPNTNETSRLYKGMIDAYIDRPIVNYVYAKYIATNAADVMDSMGYKRDKLGQHTADDVIKFFDVMNIQNAAIKDKKSRSRLLGVMDSNGNPIEFTMDEAFQKAKEINDSNQNYVAKVICSDGKFNVITDIKDSRTQIYVGEVNKDIAVWQTLKERFNTEGIDIDAMVEHFPELANPIEASNFLQYLKTLKNVPIGQLTERDVQILAVLGKGLPQMENLLTKRGWGDFNAATAKMYVILKNPKNYASTIVSSVKKALGDASTLHSSAISNTLTAIQDKAYEVKTTDESFKIHYELEKLHQKYHIGANIFFKTGKEIETLTDAAVEAMFSLERQIRNIKNREGKTVLGKELEDNLSVLQKEIANKNYYVGLLSFLSRAQIYVDRVTQILNEVPQTGTPLELAIKSGAAVAKATALREHYYNIVKALANIDLLEMNESMSKEDIESLQKVAQKIYKALTAHENMMRDLRRSTVANVVTTYIGDNVINGVPLATLLSMAENDSSFMDQLYSCERASDPILSCMGTMIRDAQQVRDHKMALLYQDIRACKRRLGNQRTEFMYDHLSNGRIMIKSKYNWEEFYKERNKEYARLKALGLDGFVLQDEMEKWEAANMDEEVVDPSTGRTEKVPSEIYWKYPNGNNESWMETNGVAWTPEQKRYYREIMAIKGKIGSLLPSYAQKQYLPAQVRAEWTEIVERGIRNKSSMSSVLSNLRNRMKQTIALENKEGDREQKEDFGYIPNSDNVDITYSDYDDHILKKIPVYFIHPMKDQSNVSLDFTASLEALASTAVNYSAMDSIKNTIDTMADFLKGRPVSEKSPTGKRAVDVIDNTTVSAVKGLAKHASATKTMDLIDGWLSMHFYNERVRTDINPKVSKLIQGLLGYSSLNNLAPNVKGGLANYLVGEAQMMIEGLAGSIAHGVFKTEEEFYRAKDYLWAHALMFGDKFGKGVVMDHLTNDVTSKGHLLEQMFDPLQELSSELGNNVYDSVFQRLFGGFNPMFLYSSGESLIHLTNMYAVLNNVKVLVDGKKTSLYNALERVGDEDKNFSLKVKEGTTTLDGNAVDDAFLQKVKNKIRMINQLTHGSMNAEDKGTIHRRMIGRLAMQFRQWMVEHYSRRYRGRYFDGTTKTWREGYWTTLGKFIASFWKDYEKFGLSVKARWNQLDNAQKMNIARVFSEMTILEGLVGISGLLIGEPDDDDDFAEKLAKYEIKRLIFEEQAAVPFSVGTKHVSFVGPLFEGIKLLNSPIASVKTAQGLLYPLSGLMSDDLHSTYERGKYKGKNKYWTKVKKRAILGYDQIEGLIYFYNGKDDKSIFRVFDPDY